jgi:truncated hemoglobin YjbI
LRVDWRGIAMNARRVLGDGVGFGGPVEPELRHRGPGLVVYPEREIWNALGGALGVTALIQDLYRRIERNELLSKLFPHFNNQAATPFFLHWFGGNRDYCNDLEGGLVRRHQNRHISPKAADAWLRCMREALVDRGVPPDPVMTFLAPITKAMIHSPETDPSQLRKTCGAVQDAAQVRFETVLSDAAKGRTENVRKALQEDQGLAARRGINNQTLVWVAAYHNRRDVLNLALEAGADCNSPGCDPSQRRWLATAFIWEPPSPSHRLPLPRSGGQPSLARSWSMARSTMCSRRRGWEI